MASGLYNQARQAFLQGSIDWANDNIDVLLVQDTYTFAATQSVVANLSSHELSATDYTRQDLTGRSVGGAGTTTAVAANPTWSGIGNGTNQTIGGAVVFKNSGADATSTLICFIDTVDITTQDTNVTLSLAGGVVFTWANSS
jgi:hypothetical protein